MIDFYSDVDPASLDEGVVRRLPSSLDQSVAALEENEVLKEALGLPLVKAIIAIRHVRFLILQFSNLLSVFNEHTLYWSR